MLATLNLVDLYLEHTAFAAFTAEVENLKLFCLILEPDDKDRLFEVLRSVEKSCGTETDSLLLAKPRIHGLAASGLARTIFILLMDNKGPGRELLITGDNFIFDTDCELVPEFLSMLLVLVW
jgi:hypothetical protein